MANEFLYTFQCKKCGKTIQIPGQYSPDPKPVGKYPDGSDCNFYRIDCQRNK